LAIVDGVVCLLLCVDGGKLEVWDPASEASSPLCSVLADDAAIVQIAVRVEYHHPDVLYVLIEL